MPTIHAHRSYRIHTRQARQATPLDPYAIWTPLIVTSTYLCIAVHYNMAKTEEICNIMARRTYSQGYYITEPELSRLELLPELAA